jgi:hypothetical protein
MILEAGFVFQKQGDPENEERTKRRIVRLLSVPGLHEKTRRSKDAKMEIPLFAEKDFF